MVSEGQTITVNIVYLKEVLIQEQIYNILFFRALEQ